MCNAQAQKYLRGSPGAMSKQSGVLGVTCRESYEEDDRAEIPTYGRNCQTGAPGNCFQGLCGLGQPEQQGWNMGSPGMPQGWNMGSPGMPQGWNMNTPRMPQGWNTGGQDYPQGLNPGWIPCCSPDESESDSSSSSSTSSSDSDSIETKTKSTEVDVNPNISPWYNYEFCTCDAPLPDAYIPKPKPKKKPPPPAGPKAGIWCGSPCCAVAEYFPTKGKGVVLSPLQLKLKEASSAVPPGTCCYRNDQLIFQVPNKGHKSDSDVLPVYNVGPDEQQLGVKMMQPEENPEMDPDNNTYIIKITKTDAEGKPAKLQLALKIPRPPDTSVPENETTTQYATEDPNAADSTGHGGKKVSKTVSWSKTATSTKRKSKKPTKTKTSKVGGSRKLTKGYKKAAK